MNDFRPGDPAQDRLDAYRLRELRRMCGYVEDDSHGSVEIFQDDATRTWHVMVDRRRQYFADTFTGALDAAIAGETSCLSPVTRGRTHQEED